MQLSLSKKQTKAYQKIYQIALETEQLEAFEKLQDIQEKSTRELLLVANRFESQARQTQARQTQAPPQSTHSKNAMLHCLKFLGHTQARIARKLSFSTSTVSSKINSNTFPLLIQQELRQGKSPDEIAAMYQCPQALILAVALKGKLEQERLQEIQWEIKTQPRWNWAKGDLRFAEKENAEIQPQLIAHMLYYFVPENALLMEAIAEDNVVSLVCLSLNRRCFSFSTPEKAEQHPGLFPHLKEFVMSFGRLFNFLL